MKIYYITLFIAFTAALHIGCSSQQNEERQNQTETAATEERTPAETAEAAPMRPVAKNQKAVISTDFGDMTIILYDETPVHRDNFIKLASDGFFDGTLFHRVIKDFMIQGGDPESRSAAPNQPLGRGGPGYTLPAEFSPEFIHKKGALAAARQGDQMNPERRSSGSQFYIVQGKKVTPAELNTHASRTGAIYTTDQIRIYEEIGGTPFLDNQYTVFGEVIEGLEVIDQIANVQTGGGNRPVQDVKMTVRLINE